MKKPPNHKRKEMQTMTNTTEKRIINTTDKRMTKKDYFNEVIKLAKGEQVNVTADELVKFAEHELNLLERRRTSNSKPTKTQKENELIKDVIMQVLETSNDPLRIADIQARNEQLAEYTNQKISALLTQLVNEGTAKREVIKRQAHFIA